MIKREELTNPKSCMIRAREDEMTFVEALACADAMEEWRRKNNKCMIR